jgi:two-component system, NarL family, response regulator LiaR
MITVLIVDDHPVMRELLRQVVQKYPDLALVAEAGYGEDAVSQATRLQPAVALIDVHLPTMSGIETTKLIKLRSPLTVIIGLTASEPDNTDMAMLSAGACVVISKADLFHRLYPCILEAVKSLKAAI